MLKSSKTLMKVQTPGLIPPTTTTISYYRFAGKAVGYATDGILTTTAAGHLGSTEITNTGGAISRQTYLPFGAVRSTATNTLGTDQTYTGQIDDGTGLLHYRARQYDPQLGRFIQADLITVDGLNRYTYTGNSPTGRIDPSGQEQCGYRSAPGQEAGEYVCWDENEAATLGYDDPDLYSSASAPDGRCLEYCRANTPERAAVLEAESAAFKERRKGQILSGAIAVGEGLVVGAAVTFAVVSVQCHGEPRASWLAVFLRAELQMSWLPRAVMSPAVRAST